MFALFFFTVLAIATLAASAHPRVPWVGKVALLVMAPCLFITGFLIGSSVVIGSDMTGVVIKHIGAPLPTGAIVAQNGEQGYQADILGPGWHFGYIPFLYEVEEVPVIAIPPGKLGFVSAKDGAALPDGETYAKAWEKTSDMLNPLTFLTQGGQRGPQSTVLSPGTYRYNPKLHEIREIDVLVVAPGTVAVIKSNTGPITSASASSVLVNGNPLVERGQRGVWREALRPGAYYLNTQALMPTTVKTTQRIYTYQQRSSQHGAKTGKLDATDWSVVVRSKDGFSFPVDVRVGCAVEADNASYLVALLGDPDRVLRDEQEDEDLEVMESKMILPAVRAIFRNVAETMNALEFVNARSQVEKVATERMQTELRKFHITCDGVFVGNIHLDADEAGRKLLTTQTDKEVAVNEQKLYGEKKLAEESRSSFVKAQEEAEQQRNLAKATYEVLVKEQGAKARAAEAKGEADYQIITGEGRARAYEAMVKTLGQQQVAQLELLKLVAEGKVQITPQVLVTGGGTLDALAGTLLRQQATTGGKP